MAPAFIITIDTEGDDLWARPRVVTTKNAASLPRFQALAERFGLKPTWLVNWEMAQEPRCGEFLRDVAARGAGEVGAHLHAWDNPPIEPLTDNDTKHHPFLTEYPEPVMRAKLECLAEALENTFRQKLRSHRAGRWALDGRYARMLHQRGFTVDCSICPGVDWRSTKGNPMGTGGPDYRGAPSAPYFLDGSDVTQVARETSGETLLEVPMTTGMDKPRFAAPLVELRSKRHYWLRPNGRNGAAMRERVNEAADAGKSFVMFMLHSSELMAGGSPTFRDAESIETLYRDLEALFEHARAKGCAGRTLGEFAENWRAAATQAG